MKPRPHWLALALPLSAALSAQDRAVIVEASKLVVASRTTLEGENAKLAFRDGKVIGVGSEIPRNLLDTAQRLKLEGATVVPGFVVAHDYLELRRDLGESIDAFTPSLEAGDAFDPFDEALVRHARGGVTTIGLAPSSANTVGGLGAVVQWRGEGGEVIVDTTYLKLALVPESLNQNRYPTSRMGAADLIRGHLKTVSTALAPRNRDHRTLADVLSGGRTLAIHARTVAEITEALHLCKEFELRPIVLGADEAKSCISALQQAGATVALSPLDFDDKIDTLSLPSELERAGIAFSFMGGHPDQLRRSAALAVRAGASREAAIAALTRTAAEQIGAAATVGSLRVGYRADFAAYSGNPLDLTSKPLATFVAGERVPEKEEDK